MLWGLVNYAALQVCVAHMSLTLNGSSALQRFEQCNVVKIQDGHTGRPYKHRNWHSDLWPAGNRNECKLHLCMVIPVQLMRTGIGQNTSWTCGGWLYMNKCISMYQDIGFENFSCCSNILCRQMTPWWQWHQHGLLLSGHHTLLAVTPEKQLQWSLSSAGKKEKEHMLNHAITHRWETIS